MAAREYDKMSAAIQCGHPRAVRYCALAAVIMAYGWGYRGTVGHEQGAMVPAALLGLVLCLGAGRVDWHRRAVVVGFCAAVGWAWGGSISYMEQTFYVLSDSFYDVLYGYTMLFFIGALWAGCGGAILGLGLTEPRSDLEGLTRPFIWLGLVYLLGYLYLACVPEHNEAYETFTVHHFHDGDWLSATLAFMVGALYVVVRPKDRRGALLIMSAAMAWWIGYGLLTKLGGLRLVPLHRSESWGGVLGVLIALVIFLVRRRNWAALMLSLYGTVGGGLAFALAVFVHNLLVTRWGPFAQVQLPLCAWRLTEVTFGGLMGFALALGTLRLLRGGLKIYRCPSLSSTPSAIPWRHCQEANGLNRIGGFSKTNTSGSSGSASSRAMRNGPRSRFNSGISAYTSPGRRTGRENISCWNGTKEGQPTRHCRNVKKWVALDQLHIPDLP